MIAKKRKIFILVCFIAVLLSTFGVVFSNAVDGDAASIQGSLESGRKFSNADKLELQRDLESMPKTYEAVVYVPESTSKLGVIFGNYIRETRSTFTFRISPDGKPELQIIDKDINTVLNTFDYDIRGNEWVHVAITHEVLEGGARFRCYINGELIGTNETDVSYELDMHVAQSAVTPYIGRDFRNEYYFKGRIKNLALYTEALTPAEIAASFNNGVGTHSEDLLACYDLTNAAGSNYISDLTGNGYDFAPQYFEREEEKTDYAYSFAVVGDTQYLIYKDAHSGTSYTSYIYDWIVKNKTSKNIQFVMGLGDITDKDGVDNSSDSVDQTDKEWTLAVSEHQKLTNAGIPYTVIRGNHDTVPQLDKYFAGNSNFSAMDIEYFDGTSLGNYFVRFTVGETKYMVLCLDYELPAGSDELLWANTAIEQNPDCKVIITTHNHTQYDGSRKGDVWDSLVTYNKNVIMVISGHIGKTANTAKSFSVGAAGHTVLELLVDPQYLDTNYVYKNVGMVGMLYFSADGKEVDFEYISTQATLTNQSTDETAQDVFYGRKNQFSFTIPDEPELVTTKYGVITDSTWADASVYPFVIFDENGNCIGAATEFTGKGSSASAIGIAKTHLDGNTWSGGNHTGTVRTATILMRANHSMPNQYYDNTSLLEGLLTVDLNGYTLSAPTNGTKNYPLLRVQLKTSAEYPTEIVFKNGNINLKHQELFLLYGNISGKTFKAEFENVNFTVKKTSSTTFFGFAARYGTSTYDIYPEICFTDCVIDISGSNATESIKLFDVGSDKVHTTITVRGGNIITGGKVFSILGKTSDATQGKLIFSEYEGAYTYLTLPEGKELPSEVLSNGTDNVVFAKYATENGNDVYRLTYEYIDTKYGKIPAKFTFADKYPFVVFNEKGECINAEGTYEFYPNVNLAKAYLKYNAWNGTSYSSNGGAARTAVVLMRRDYSIAGTAYYDNISQVRGTITIDLDGYTLTRSGGEALMRSTMKAWTDKSSGDGLSVFPTELIFKNGNIDLKNGPLAKYGASAAGKQLTYGFIDINFTVTGTTGAFAATHSGTNGLGLKPEMYFENCVIDITGGSTQSILLFNLGDETTFLSVRISGCEIKAKNTGFAMFAKDNEISTGTFIVRDSDSVYNMLTLPVGVSAPVYDGVEFVKVSEKTESVTYRIKPAAIEEFSYVPKTSITLDSQLVMNVYIPLNYTQKFTFNGETYEDLTIIADKKVTVNGDEYYHFTIALGSAEAAKDIKLVSTVALGNNTAEATFTFSIPKYAAKVINSNSATNVEKTLSKDVLAYIKAAYNYFTTLNTVEEIARVNALIDSILTIGGDYDGTPVSSGVTNTASPVSAVTLNLDAKPSIRFYVADTNVSFYENGRKLNTVSGTDANGTYVELDVYAYVLSETITYGEGGSYHISDFLTKSAGEDHENLVACFIKYVESAANYRMSVIGGNK